MSLTADDKAWINALFDKKLSIFGSLLVNHIPRGFKYNVLTAVLGFAACSVVMDIKNKDIPHISHPMAALESSLVEAAGLFAVYTGGWLADYNRMHPSQTYTQLIIGLTNQQAQAFMLTMRKRESSNNYSKIHEFAYLGAYGMGASALADIGWIKRSKYDAAPDGVKRGFNRIQHLAFLKDNNNWTRYSFEEFMENKTVQDTGFVAYANTNIQRGFKKGALKRGDHKRLAGYAAASHLVGPNDAFLYYSSNMDADDRYGTTASEYAKLGENSIKGAAPKDIGSIPSGFPMRPKHYTRISSGFGVRKLKFKGVYGPPSFHGGIDFPVPVGTDVKATADGKVLFAGNYGGSCGYGVKVQHNDNYATVYCHLSKWHVRSSQWVRKGAKLGESGGVLGAKGSGKSTGPHIHYAIKHNGKAIDPYDFIPQLSVKKTFAIRPQQLPLPTRGGMQ